MKTKFTFAAAAFAFAVICSAPSFAQVAHPQHTAKIPFAFTVGGTQMPAGEYAITEYGNRLQVRPLDGGKAVFVTALPLVNRTPAISSHLSFQQRGEGPTLSTLYFAGRETAIEMLKK